LLWRKEVLNGDDRLEAQAIRFFDSMHKWMAGETDHLKTTPAADTCKELIAHPYRSAGIWFESGYQAGGNGDNNCTDKAPRKIISQFPNCSPYQFLELS
jgi:hypothetical protein